MCLNCGCGQPDERHGNDANITAADVRRAGDANGQDLATSARNMVAALRSVADDSRAGSGVRDERSPTAASASGARGSAPSDR